MQTHHSHDLIIAGGGMVGLSLALAASQAGLKTALIEQQPYQNLDDQPDQFAPRVSALNHASERLLTNLGAWQNIPAHRKAVYRDMQVWDGLGQGEIEFNSLAVQKSHLGHIVENRFIVDALWQCAFECNELTLLTGHTIAQWHQKDSTVTVETDLGETLTAALLVGSEGKHSPVRQAANLDQWQWSYDHTAIVTTVWHEQSHEDIARQVFLETGPLAFLPLQTTDGRHASSIVWSAKTAEAERLQNLNEDEFLVELNHAFEGRLGKLEQVDPRFSFPLTASQSKRYVDGRVVIIGDAAHTIHPLAGLGVNLGFLDAATLAQEVIKAHQQSQDIGGEFPLRRFQRQRQSHNLAVGALMEGLKRLFDTQLPVPVLIRNQGLNLFNGVSLLKRPLIQGALGDFGTPLPELCR